MSRRHLLHLFFPIYIVAHIYCTTKTAVIQITAKILLDCNTKRLLLLYSVYQTDFLNVMYAQDYRET